MVQALPLVLQPTQGVEYLDPLFILAERQGSLTVATLNYDRTIEMLGELRSTSVSIGLSDSDSSGMSWPNGGIHLLKLHGSVDWRYVDQRREVGFMPERRVRVDPTPETRGSALAVVFGERGKLRAEGPFLEIFRKFEDELSEANELVVIGYSFRDEHVNELVRRWLNAVSTRRVVVIDPYLSIQTTNPAYPSFVSQMFQSAGPGTPNQRVFLMQEPADIGLPKVIAPD